MARLVCSFFVSDIPFYKLHDSQILYTFGLIGTVASIWPIWKRRKMLVSKRVKEDPTMTTYIIAIGLSFVSGTYTVNEVCICAF